MILATLALFLALARSSELVVTRAAGRSALRAVAAPARRRGAGRHFAVAVLNPIVAATTRATRCWPTATGASASALSVSDEGLWLRQGGADGQTVIHAARSNLDGTELSEVSFLAFDLDGTPGWRVEARTARLVEGGWQVAEAKRWRFDTRRTPRPTAEAFETLLLPSTLTADQIRASFGAPSSIPVWALPQFIERLERAGFAARRHRVWLHMELANPLFSPAMVLVAAAFTLRHTRRRPDGGDGRSAALLMAFALYFLRNFAQILGENGQIPVRSPPGGRRWRRCSCRWGCCCTWRTDEAAPRPPRWRCSVGRGAAAAAQPASLVADTVRIEADDTLVAEGNVEVFYEDARLGASRVTYNRETERADDRGADPPDRGRRRGGAARRHRRARAASCRTASSPARASSSTSSCRSPRTSSPRSTGATGA